MNSIAKDIMDFLETRSHVSFVELSHNIKGFNGNLEMVIDDPLGVGAENIVLWGGMSEDACNAVWYLRDNKFIELSPASTLVYLLDGQMMNLPIATGRRKYKKPHWCPTVLNKGSNSSPVATSLPENVISLKANK